MNCKKFQNHIDSYFDGELSRHLEKELLNHKNSCESCRKLFVDRQEIFNMMTIAADEHWKVDLVSDVMNQIDQMPAVTPVSPFRWPVIIAIGCGIFVGTMIFMIGLGSVIGGFSLVDAAKTLISVVDLPPEIQNSIQQLTTLGKGLMTGLSAIVDFLLKMIKLLLLSSPYLFIPLFVLVLSVVIALFFLRNKYGSKIAFL